ncbi:MAG: DUF4062 domain-containing protein [Acidobacteriota bacterium]|nr:DUF4062 domain-containing protein [Acidobacteriota bacterium]
MLRRDLTFRVFISSTFGDLIAERNALQEHAFKNLRNYCQQLGARFQAIDLRWGVSEEAALDQQTMNICMQELRRCQEVSPRPNFMVLLGDRYGWRPLPPQIPAEELERLFGAMTEQEKTETKQWYRRDDNAVPPEYVLQPRTGEYENYDRWAETETRLHEILLRTARRVLPSNDKALNKYSDSATHQEIRCGALQGENLAKNVFAYFRSIDDLPQDDQARDYRDIKDHTVDTEAHARLLALRAELKVALPRHHVYEYSAQWQNVSPVSSLQALCDRVESDLRSIIEEELASSQTLATETVDKSNKAPSEQELHELFADDRMATGKILEQYSFDAGMLQTIANYMASPAEHPLAVCAEAGAGGSALMALAVQRARERYPFAHVIARFVGVTPASTDGKSLLIDLCRQLGECYTEQDLSIPPEETDLFVELQKRLRLAAASAPVILFLDGLQNLIGSNSVLALEWLPTDLPSRVHIVVVVSSSPSKCLSAIKARLPEHNQVHLKSRETIAHDRVAELLDLSLRAGRRTLQNDQRTKILQTVDDAVLTPLYLKVLQSFAFEEARQWHSYEGVPEYNGKPGFASDIRGILSDILWRVSQRGKHDEVLVSRCLGYLAVSRMGLAEDELLDILARDVDVYDRFLRFSFHPPPDLVMCVAKHLSGLASVVAIGHNSLPSSTVTAEASLADMRRNSTRLRAFLSQALSQPDGPRLPVAVWARLHFDLAPYIARRIVDGTCLLDFFHIELRSILLDEYLSPAQKLECHRRLAEYFDRQPIWITRKEGPVANSRRISELQYHQRTTAELCQTKASS